MNLTLKRATIGCSTATALTSLVTDNSRITALYVFAYRHPPLLQSRVVLSANEQVIVEKAISLRTAYSLPFWEAVMLSCFDEKRDYTRLLHEASFHQTHRNALGRISRDEVLDGHVIKLAESQWSSENLSFSSLVELVGQQMEHIPLLDFHCPETPNNDRLVTEVSRRLYGAEVLLFSSGESYHAVGLETLKSEVLREFLTKSLMFAPIVDSRYIAHQLLEGACALRLSCSPEKRNMPRLKLVVSPVDRE